jgi:hypothetical protein
MKGEDELITSKRYLLTLTMHPEPHGPGKSTLPQTAAIHTKRQLVGVPRGGTWWFAHISSLDNLRCADNRA